MREMKDSGIEWIGEIPRDWEVIRVKNKFTNHKYVVGEKSDEYERLALTLKGVIKRSKTDGEGLQPEKFDGYQILTKGELVFKLIDLENISTSRVGLSPYTGIVSPAYIILNGEKDSRFGEYYFLSMWHRAIFNSLGGDGVRSALNAKDLLKLPYLRLDYPTQQRIADYLDSKCAEIDAAIEKTKATIEEYKRLKQSVITEAVTKGLNPDVEMKDSGIEWIGEIPKHWGVKPFRHILKERNEKNSPIKSTERLSLSIDLGITLYSEKTTNLDRFKDDFEQYKLAHEGDLVMNSMNMIVGASGVSKYFGCVSPVYYTFYDELGDHATSKFCEYIFRSKTMLRVLFSLGKGIYAIQRGDDRVNTCRLKVSKEDLKSLSLPIPSADEQRQIIEHISNESYKIDNIIKQKQTIITELESYKKSLIYECITGKMEV